MTSKAIQRPLGLGLADSLYLIPQRIQLLERRLSNLQTSLFRQSLHSSKSGSEFDIGAIESERRMHAGFSAQVHGGEQQISQLVLETLIARVVLWRRLMYRARSNLGADFGQLLFHLL